MSAVETVQQTLGHKKPDKAQAVLDALAEAGYLVLDDGFTTFEQVEVPGARVRVETVEAYGLTIEVDANGNAVRVSSPWGLGPAE